MSVASLCLGLYLTLIGAIQLFKISVSPTLLGALALIAGIIILVDQFRPLGTVGRRQQ